MKRLNTLPVQLYSQLPVRRQLTWGGALSGAGQGAAVGASIGSIFPGAGTAIGAGVGALVGGIFGNRSSNKRRDAEEAARRRAALQRSNARRIANGNEAEALLDVDQYQLANMKLSGDNDLFMAGGGKIKKGDPPTTTTLTDAEKELHLRMRKNQARLTKAYDTKFGDKIKVKEVLKKHSDPYNFNRKKLNDYANNVIKEYNDYALTPEEIKATLGSDYPSYVSDLKTYSNSNWAKFTPGFAGSLESDTTDVSSLRFGARQLLERFNWNESMGTPYEYLLDDNSNKVKANGGSTKGVNVKGGNYLILKNGAKLLLNDDGTTNGSHENGDNIPLKKGNKTVALAEPGEVVVDDFVLSKRLGFADKYLELENMKEDITKQQKMLPKYNASLLKSLKLKGGVPVAAGGAPLKSGGFDLSKGYGILSGISTIGNLLLSNETADDQQAMLDEQYKVSQSYRPHLRKPVLYDDNVDVTDMISEINRGYSSSISQLDLIGDMSIRNALRGTANVNRLGQLNKVYGDRNRTKLDIRNKNADIVRATRDQNFTLDEQAQQYKATMGNQIMDNMITLRGVRLANYQNAISEFNSIISDQLAMKSIDKRFENDIKDRYKPTWSSSRSTSIPTSTGTKSNIFSSSPSKTSLFADEIDYDFSGLSKKFGGKLTARKRLSI